MRKQGRRQHWVAKERGRTTISQSRLALEAHNKLPETPWMIETFQSNNKPCLQGAQVSFLQEGKILLANMKAIIIPSKQQSMNIKNS
jgi:hypothetical protein